MLQDRATSEENAARFVERVKRHRLVWGLFSKSGNWAFCPSHDERDADVLVFWSDRAYAVRHAKEGWKKYEPTSIALDLFIRRHLKVMHEDGLLVSPNWDAHLCGIEMKAIDLARRLESTEGEANKPLVPTPGSVPHEGGAPPSGAAHL